MPALKSSSAHVGGIDDRLCAQQVGARRSRACCSSSAGRERAGSPFSRCASSRSRKAASASATCRSPLAALRARSTAPLAGLHVGKDELKVDGLQVTHRVDAAVDMDDVGVFKAAHHMHDGVAPRGCGRETCCQAPRPGRRPCTSPAMSTNSTVAGVTFSGW